jgi:hypothetical protein
MRRFVIALASVSALAARSSGSIDAVHGTPSITQSVAGSGVHFFTTAVIHSKEQTEVGMIQRSTEIVELKGDLTGRVLYQPISVFDFVKGTLVNTGHQVFSGTVLGSPPVMLYDDQFRFEVNLSTGVEFGEVHLSDRLAGPKVRCDLVVTGTGAKTPEGNAIAEYSGTCTFKK